MEIESYFNKLEESNGWETLFKELAKIENERNKTVPFERSEKYTELNRYLDVLPYKHSRIHLIKDQIDYINANLVKVEKSNRKYILTQGALKETVKHFWLMIWEQNCKNIVMLNNLIENCTEKCYKYWPNDKTQFKEYSLIVKLKSEKIGTHYTKRTFILTDNITLEKREVNQFHFTSWPDFGLPKSTNSFLKFLFEIQKTKCFDHKNGPVVVHCSAGIGRSGTFCLVDSCLFLVNKYKRLSNEDILNVLNEMRSQRMGLIQTPGQLKFSYLAIIEGSKIISNEISSTDDESEVVVKKKNGVNETRTNRQQKLGEQIRRIKDKQKEMDQKKYQNNFYKKACLVAGFAFFGYIIYSKIGSR